MINEHKYHYLHPFQFNSIAFESPVRLESANFYNKERVSLQYAAIAPANKLLLVQYCHNNVSSLRLLRTRNVYLYDF